MTTTNRQRPVFSIRLGDGTRTPFPCRKSANPCLVIHRPTNARGEERTGRGEGWKVSHAPSGLGVCHADTLAAARRACALLLDAPFDALGEDGKERRPGVFKRCGDALREAIWDSHGKVRATR